MVLELGALIRTYSGENRPLYEAIGYCVPVVIFPISIDCVLMEPVSMYIEFLPPRYRMIDW